jgi:glutamate N-acetyltransferase/amino-acid N-acetyltransferase
VPPLTTLPDGSITSPTGFSAGAASAGLRSDGTPDVGVLVSELSCSCAGVFTQNRVRAAPISYDEALLSERPGRLRGIVMNSQIANACTGETGLEAAGAMADAAEKALDIPPRSFLVLSTGAIGVQLPTEAVAAGVREAADVAHLDGGIDVARAIMTTDRSVKHIGVEVEATGGKITVGGIAKGSGMVHPNMATVLGVITTDAVVDVAQLGPLLHQVTDRTFNAITIDGDTSPNDTVLMLANGASEVEITRDREAWDAFEEAVEFVARELALMIVRDGEGAGRFIELTVAGAGTEAVARTIGRAIGTSALVKTAWAGGEPNWGRMLVAAGSSGFPVEADRLRVMAQVRAEDGGPQGDWVVLAEAGTGTEISSDTAREVFSASEVAIRLELGMGGAEATVWTCDMTEGYVRMNCKADGAK